MATQKFMGRGQLIDRLAEQVGSRDMALEILKKRGHVDSQGRLTAEGRKRDQLTAEERAKDRAAKRTGKPASSFTYNPLTNLAKLRR